MEASVDMWKQKMLSCLSFSKSASTLLPCHTLFNEIRRESEKVTPIGDDFLENLQSKKMGLLIGVRRTSLDGLSVESARIGLFTIT